MSVQVLFYIAIAIIITWIIVWVLRKNEKNAKYKALRKELSENHLTYKKGTVQYQWVAFCKLSDEHFEGSDVSAVLVDGKIKLMLDTGNLSNLHTDVHLLRQMNEALHNANNDFDQHITGQESAPFEFSE